MRHRHHLYGREAMALLAADQLADHELVDEIVGGHDVAAHGYATPDELRLLAAQCLVLARRLDARTVERNA